MSRGVLFIIFLAGIITTTHILDVNALVITNQTANGMYISHSQMIGIQISQVCATMEKNHMKSNCITYDKIKQFDNTDPTYAGQWVNDTWYHRLAPRISNHEVMNLNPFVIMVDPNNSFTTRAKMIIVQSDNFTWINPDEAVGNNHTRIEHHNRQVSNCEQASVAPDINLIKDTVIYLESGCTITKYNDKVLIKTGNLPFSFVNPYSSLHYNSMLKNLLHGHSGFGGNHTAGGIGPSNCITIKCEIPKNPYAKW